MSLRIKERADDDDEAWDVFVAGSANGTFLHSRRYTSYHGDRFLDRSVIAEDQRGRIVALFAAAQHPTDERTVVSHPGLTYGGIVHDGTLQGPEMIELLGALAARYRDLGYRRLVYKAVPFIYHRVPSGDDIYALFRLGAIRSRCDLSSTIDLSAPVGRNRNRRRNLAKSIDSDVAVASGIDWIPRFWPALEENLGRRFGVEPTHSLGDIMALAERFPDHIECQVALVQGRLAAGVVLYKTPLVVHPQYSAATEEGRTIAALDACFEAGIVAARAGGVRFYDFGISTSDEGAVLNESLYRYKSSFGAGGVPYEFYELALVPT